MKITEVLERVDSLYPNPYTAEEKVRWCYDVSCGIRDNILKLYNTREQVIKSEGEQILLPVGVKFWDVDSVFINGKKVKKVDARSFSGHGLKVGDVVRVVYKTLPDPFSVVDGVVDEACMTEVDAPYDGLYVDYVCAQVAFYQDDLDDYNKFITMYNEKLHDFAVKYRQTAPIIDGRGYKNLWA